MLDTRGAAKFLGLSASFLAKARMNGTGPKYAKLGKKVVYREQDLVAFLDAHMVEASSAQHGTPCGGR